MVSLGGTQPTEWLFGLCISTYNNEWFPTIRSLWDFFCEKQLQDYHHGYWDCLPYFWEDFPTSNAFGILSIKARRIPSNKRQVAILHRFGPARFLGFRTAMIVTIDNPEY